MNAENKTASPDLERLRNQNGVDFELFGYLHPIPECVVEDVGDEDTNDTFLHCIDHDVISGAVPTLYIPK